MPEDRITKRQFIAMVARQAKVPVKVAEAVYEAIIELLLSNVRVGRSITLSGFGRFYGQKHKGHSVQFGSEQSEIKDYSVLKFSATRAVNKSLTSVE